MKKNLSAAAALFLSAALYAQVGVNNTSPKATFDVTAKTTDGSKPEGLIVPRLTGNQIQSADAQYGSDQKGAMIYATAAVTSSTSKTVNITAEGYYYFDGSLWQKMGNTAAANSWGLNGNAGTDPAVNYIGTTDAKDIVFKSGSDYIGYIDNSNQSNTSLGWNAGNHSPGNGGGGGMANTAIGYGAGYSLTNVASSNVFVGLTAGQNVQTGSSNTGLGSSALDALVSGNNNVAVGMNSGLNVTSGAGNTFIGASAGSNVTTGINNIIIGKEQQSASATGSYQLNIGGAIFGTGLNGNAGAPAGNIGFGTAAPQSRLHIVGDGGIGDDMFINSSSSSATSSGLSAFYRSRGTYAAPSAVANGDWLGTSTYQGHDGTNYTGGARITALVNGTVSSGSVPTDLLFSTGSSAITEKMRIHSNGNVGIGTANPGSTLEVNGSATNTSAYNAGNSTTIDFSKSNLAYTSASAGNFTLQNIKDGGTYSLSVQGTTSGTSSFAAAGFTFKYVNNNASIANTHTLYTFVVMGPTVYVYCVRGL